MRPAHRLGLSLGLSFALVVAATEARATFEPDVTVGPTANLSIDSLSAPVPIEIVGSTVVLNSGGSYTLLSGDGQEKAVVTGSGTTDPSFSYTLSLTNSDTVTHTFSFNASIPVVSTPAGTTVTSTLFGTLTGPLDGASGTISPVAGNAGIQEGSVNGVSLPALFVGAAQTNTGTMDYPTVMASTVSGSTINTLDVSTTLTLSAGATATLNGTIAVVPEPASAALMALGTLALGLVCRCAAV